MCTIFLFCKYIQFLFSCYLLCLSPLPRATASIFLEKQIQNVEGIVSGFEEQLAKDGVILDQPNAPLSRNMPLQVLYFIMQPKYLTISG